MQALYGVAMLISLCLFLTSRHLVTYKRWHDLSCLLGFAFFCWGIGLLFGMNEHPGYQWGAFVITFLYSFFFLLAFRSFPLAPHLYFDRWKTVMDLLLLAILYFVIAVTIWEHPEEKERLQLLLRIQTDLYLAGMGGALVITNWRHAGTQNGNLLLFGCIGFLLLDATAQRLPVWLAFVLVCASFALILFSLYQARRQEEKVDVMDEYEYFYEKLEFALRDENLTILWMLLAAVLTAWTPDLPQSYRLGMGVFLLIAAAKWVLTKVQNRQVREEVFYLSRNLEKHFEESTRQMRKQNEDFSRLLAEKQNYEKLLLKSSEYSMQDVTYENLQQIMEGFVDIWYSIVKELAYLRVSLQSADGMIYYATVRGDEAKLIGQTPEVFRYVVDNKQDTPLAPRYVVVECVSARREWSNEAEPFYHLLALQICWLFQRCVQGQQSMEIRLMEQEMELASKIQFSLIPRGRLTLPHVEAKAVYIPAMYVGGDYVDFVVLDDRYTVFLVADISGHGIPASLLTTGLRSSFRAVIQTCTSPDEILSRLNQLLYDDLVKTRSFVTILVVVFDKEEGMLRFSRAGHPSPLYLSRSRRMELPTRRGIGLGLSPNARYPLDEWRVTEDFLLLMYTDGLMELGRGREPLDVDEWLNGFAQAAFPGGQAVFDPLGEVEQQIWEKKRSSPQADDISVLILHVTCNPSSRERRMIDASV